MTNKQAAIKIVKRLSKEGFEALLAGGCVRDMLLGRQASDYDVATSAKPDQIMSIFPRTLKVGAKFGVVIVLMEANQVEVATFRSESAYSDGRHPGSVTFTDAASDAGRRDFTINGMFYDLPQQKLIDYVNGHADLENKIVRTIGKPGERFEEDYLRMLRAVRFSTQLNFTIEPSTFSAICENAEKITQISGERIAIELEGILANPNRTNGAELLIRTELAGAIFPGFNKNQAKLALVILKNLPKKTDFPLALAGFFAGCETKFALEKITILKLSRNQTKHIKFLLVNRGKWLDEDMSLAQLKITLAEPYFWDLYEFEKAIRKTAGCRKDIAALRRIRKRIKSLGDIELKPKPLLNGNDLIKLGTAPGPKLGQLAQEIYIAQLEGTLQTPKQARHWAELWLHKHHFTEQ
ncbi:MAG: hypothetical protein JXB29_02535 [Sedimentisphaerales bacterium]|nr:hypothetical protein [Sedimentisphaerales bacterium]